jgi:acetyl esterase/lipase
LKRRCSQFSNPSETLKFFTMPLFEMIRLGFAITVFALALLAVFPAATNLLWRISVGVTEYGHFLALIIILPFMIPGWSTGIGRFSFAIAFCAFLLSLSPVIRAVFVAKKLPEELFAAFGKVSISDTPLSLKKLFFGTYYKRIKCETLKYASADSVDLMLDIYKDPAVKEASPCVMIVHGGAWEGGDSKQLEALNHYLAGKGYIVAAVNYRLAPEHKAPAAWEDVKKAISFLKNVAFKYSINPDCFVVLGRSAGGQIALMASYTMHDPSVKGAIAFYTPADMVWGYAMPGNPWILDSRRVLENYLGGTYQDIPENYHQATPLEYVNTDTPPTLMIHGKKDEMVAYEHNLRLKKILDPSGVKNVIVTLPWATHGLDYNFSGPGGQLSTYSVEYFLKAVCKK